MTTTVTTPLFIDMGYSQHMKHGENICGDAFRYSRGTGEHRLVSVLSDGLGSGVKANILASMTAAMALRFETESDREIIHTAEIMMEALPICQTRKISYATFTIVNSDLNGKTRIIEMGNPEFILLRRGKAEEVPFREIESPKWKNRTIKVYEFTIHPGDRVILFSDGISQAGMGTEELPLGWRVSGCAAFAEEVVQREPKISSYELAEVIRREALRKEPRNLAGDDMTCAVFYFREPRKMLVFTGPPFDPARDKQCAEMVATFDGTTAICGGTSAEIVSRELNRPLKMELLDFESGIPPMSQMEGVDLVTEGIFTLTRAAQYLENYDGTTHRNPAGKLVADLLKNDIIEILVGTRINDAHQDPNLPLDLELRRNIVKRIAFALEHNFLKTTNVKYV